MKEDKVREKNAKAARKQAQHQKNAEHVEVTARDGDYAGLTKRNEDFLFHLNKSLDEYNYDPEKKAEVLDNIYRELLDKQKSGVTATKLYGTVSEYTEKIIQGQNKKSDVRSTKSLFWLMALDNGLVMFVVFCVLYAVVGFFDHSGKAVNGGWITLLGTSFIAGISLAFFYTMMDPRRATTSGHKLLRGFFLTLELVVIWMAAFGVIGLIPVKYNATLDPVMYIILGAVAFGIRYYLKRKLNFPKIGRDIRKR